MSSTEAVENVAVSGAVLTPTPAPVASSASPVANDPNRFKAGVIVRGKLIGVEDVKKETGDDICQTSMIKLKAVVVAKKEHKQRICVKIDLDGIEILDEKTNSSMYKHPVGRISYIARDPTDSRAIGYIFKNPQNECQYFAIKTERQAQELFINLKELFEVILELRNVAKKEKEAAAAAAIAAGTVVAPLSPDQEINDPLKKKIEQMNEQSQSLFDVETSEPTKNLLFDDSLQSFEAERPVDTTSPPIKESKSTASELFDLFDGSANTNSVAQAHVNSTSDILSKFNSVPFQQQGGFPQGGGFPQQQMGGFPPQQQGGFPQQQLGGLPPQQQGGYPPQQQGGYPPQQQGGFPPQRTAPPPVPFNPMMGGGAPVRQAAPQGFGGGFSQQQPPQQQFNSQAANPFGAPQTPASPFGQFGQQQLPPMQPFNPAPLTATRPAPPMPFSNAASPPPVPSYPAKPNTQALDDLFSGFSTSATISSPAKPPALPSFPPPQAATSDQNANPFF